MSVVASATPIQPGATASAQRLLLLGLGNDILSDDAIGLLVVRQLQRELTDCPSLDIRETSEMGLALLDFLTGYSEAVIVDAIQTGQAPSGAVHELDPASLKPQTGCTPHSLGVGETLALGRELGLDMPAHVKVLAIEVADPFTLGTQMTPALQAAVPAVVQRVAAAVRALAER